MFGLVPHKVEKLLEDEELKNEKRLTCKIKSLNSI